MPEGNIDNVDNWIFTVFGDISDYPMASVEQHPAYTDI